MPDILIQIFEVCIIPLLGVLTTCLIKWINVKSNELKLQTKDKTLQKYIGMLSDTITQCVIATNQTYVESLKKKGEFTLEAQKEAFQMTLDAVLNILSDEAIEYLQESIGDLNTYISNKIEAEVNIQK